MLHFVVFIQLSFLHCWIGSDSAKGKFGAIRSIHAWINCSRQLGRAWLLAVVIYAFGNVFAFQEAHIALLLLIPFLLNPFYFQCKVPKYLLSFQYLLMLKTNHSVTFLCLLLLFMYLRFQPLDLMIKPRLMMLNQFLHLQSLLYILSKQICVIKFALVFIEMLIQFFDLLLDLISFLLNLVHIINFFKLSIHFLNFFFEFILLANLFQHFELSSTLLQIVFLYVFL